jgi:hypothetical protein
MRIAALLPALLLALLLAAPACAGSVTVMNNSGETIRRIEISPSGAPSENRLRSTLPNGATAQIGYSGGCMATLRLGYESGRTEEFAGIDPCNGGRVAAGGGVPGARNAALVTVPTTASSVATSKPAGPVKAPPPEVPPWTGRSITKRFGGME